MTMPTPPKAFEPIHVGKVRDTFEFGLSRLLIRATDRISVFDVVLGRLVPDKGKVLTALTEFWLTGILADTPNHYVGTDLDRYMPTAMRVIPDLDGRSMVVERADMLPVECIVRGYLYGSVVREYEQHGTVCGIPLPPGLVKASKLPQPLFTPSTKAEEGHDVNISFEAACALVDAKFPGRGEELMHTVELRSKLAYVAGAAYAEQHGIIIADTKFEFGLHANGANGASELLLCDEVLTPDSSRFWPADSWQPGQDQLSMDKQYVRDYYESLGWDKRPPAPPLPDDIIAETRRRYLRIYEQLTGAPLKLN